MVISMWRAWRWVRRTRPCARSWSESYPGPSLIIAYSHCIAHYRGGHGRRRAPAELVVETGQWLLTVDPRRAAVAPEPLQLGSQAARTRLQDYLLSENRFKMLTKSKREEAK